MDLFTSLEDADEEDCPDQLSGEGNPNDWPGLFGTNISILEEVKDLYTNNVDQGDTQGLIAFIQNQSNSSIEVRNEMLACVPYVSKNAWIAAFQRQDFDPWHLSQVLLASSPLKQPVIDLMYQYSLDPYYRELVLNGQNDGMTNMTILENDLVTYAAVTSRLKTDYIRHYLMRDSVSYGLDSIQNFLTMSHDVEDKYIKATLLARSGQYQLALDELGDCTSSGATDNICQVMTILYEAQNAGQECPLFTQAQYNDLVQIADDVSSLGYSMARSLLWQHYGQTWDVHIPVPSSTRSDRWREEYTSSNGMIKIRPNPTTDIAFMEVTIPDAVEFARIRIFDALGKEIQVNQLSATSVVEFDASRLGSGIYVFTLEFEGIIVEEGRITVVH